jgi:hypothetical protein
MSKKLNSAQKGFQGAPCAEPTPQERAPTSAIPTINSAEIDIAKIFSKDAKYKNSHSPVVICEKYKDFVDLLSELSKCEISQILNNILSLYFGNEDISNQLNSYAKSKYKERLQQFKL